MNATTQHCTVQHPSAIFVFFFHRHASWSTFAAGLSFSFSTFFVRHFFFVSRRKKKTKHFSFWLNESLDNYTRARSRAPCATTNRSEHSNSSWLNSFSAQIEIRNNNSEKKIASKLKFGQRPVAECLVEKLKKIWFSVDRIEWLGALRCFEWHERIANEKIDGVTVVVLHQIVIYSVQSKCDEQTTNGRKKQIDCCQSRPNVMQSYDFFFTLRWNQSIVK